MHAPVKSLVSISSEATLASVAAMSGSGGGGGALVTRYSCAVHATGSVPGGTGRRARGQRHRAAVRRGDVDVDVVAVARLAPADLPHPVGRVVDHAERFVPHERFRPARELRGRGL